MAVRVAVVGAGIAGLSSANAIQERFPEARVTLIAEKFSPDTTSDGAAGLWWPYLMEETPEEDISRYAEDTWKYLERLWKSPMGGRLGLSLIPCLRPIDTVQPLPSFGHFVYGFGELDASQVQRRFGRPDWKQCLRAVVWICEGSKLLPHLLETFRARGGVVLQRRLDALQQLADDFDVIVNCTGLGAKELQQDPLVYPIRGHIIRVKAPWIKSVLIDDSDIGNYIIPNQDTVVLGGTHDRDQWDTEPRQVDRSFVHDGCSSLFPSLKDAEVVTEWIGLRPGRLRLRVETQPVTVHGRPMTVIHNYGHGGSGLTLFWGCALRVVELLEQVTEEQQQQQQQVMAAKL